MNQQAIRCFQCGKFRKHDDTCQKGGGAVCTICTSGETERKKAEASARREETRLQKQKEAKELKEQMRRETMRQEEELRQKFYTQKQQNDLKELERKMRGMSYLN